MKKTLLIKVKWSESHSVLSDSAIPCSLPGSSIHGILQARILEWVACSFLHGIFPTQGSNPDLPNCKQILYCLSYQGGPKILEWVTYPFSSGSSRPRNWTRISCICRWILDQLIYEKGRRAITIELSEPRNKTIQIFLSVSCKYNCVWTYIF